MEVAHAQFLHTLREMAYRFFRSCIRTRYDRTSHLEMLVLVDSPQGRELVFVKLRALVHALPYEFSSYACRGSLNLMEQLNRELNIQPHSAN